jgi:ubiquinone/menaquinone biosynthesis C-methylase UbiE
MDTEARQPLRAAPVSSPAWDKSAAGWNQHSAPIRAWLQHATAAMLDTAGIAAGSRVLDIAAGAGDQTLDIARRVGPQGHVLATDISANALALAKANLRAAGYAQVETRLADAQALGLAGAGFDAAVCRLGLMFCAHPGHALDGVRQALRPGGRFSALVFSQPGHNPCLGIMMACALQHAGLPARQAFEPGTLLSLGQPGLLAQLLRDAGFLNIDVRPVTAPFLMPSSRQYVDFVRTSGSPVMEILASLPAPAQTAAWADMASRLEVFTTPGGWTGPNELLLCGATAPGTRDP